MGALATELSQEKAAPFQDAKADTGTVGLPPAAPRVCAEAKNPTTTTASGALASGSTARKPQVVGPREARKPKMSKKRGKASKRVSPDKNEKAEEEKKEEKGEGRTKGKKKENAKGKNKGKQ